MRVARSIFQLWGRPSTWSQPSLMALLFGAMAPTLSPWGTPAK